MTLEISQERVGHEGRLAMEVLANYQLRADSVDCFGWIDPDDGTERLTMTYRFHGTLAQELAMEAALADRLVHDPQWNPDRLSTEFQAVAHPQ